MSVLNQSGEEPVECPLCMEPLEVDDLNFFPCTCGYQVRINVNKAYSICEYGFIISFICARILNRYVDFVGIVFELMKMDCVLLVGKLIPKIQQTLNRFQKKTSPELRQKKDKKISKKNKRSQKIEKV